MFELIDPHLIEPLTFGAEALVAAEAVAEMRRTFPSDAIPPAPPEVFGIDGTQFRIEMGDGVTISWWSGSPVQQSEVAAWFASTEAVFDALLP